MPTARTPPWKKPNPKGQKTQPLTEAQKAAARQRAEENGRRYPNLVDNMWAAKLPVEALLTVAPRPRLPTPFPPWRDDARLYRQRNVGRCAALVQSIT